MIDYPELKDNALKFLVSMRNKNTWEFKFSPTNPCTLIASCVAGMLAHFLDYTQTLTEQERIEWAAYIKGFQNREGWFEDFDIDDQHRLDWYGRDRALFHRTRHALCALDALGEQPSYRLRMVDRWIGPHRMRDWLGTLDFRDYWYASNMMMDLFLLLAHEYHYNPCEAALDSIRELLDYCDENTHPKTGFHDQGLSETRNAMAGAMHLFPAYFLCHRKPKYPGTVVRTTLSLQQEDGLFGYENGSGGEDCLDYDAVLILVNFYFLTGEFKSEIEQSIQKCQKAVLTCLNADGGFSPHRRGKPYNFGTKSTLVEVGNSSLWATYGRLLTIAMAGRILNPSDKTFILGKNLMEIWDGGIGKMDLHPPLINI